MTGQFLGFIDGPSLSYFILSTLGAILSILLVNWLYFGKSSKKKIAILTRLINSKINRMRSLPTIFLDNIYQELENDRSKVAIIGDRAENTRRRLKRRFKDNIVEIYDNIVSIRKRYDIIIYYANRPKYEEMNQLKRKLDEILSDGAKFFLIVKIGHMEALANDVWFLDKKRIERTLSKKNLVSSKETIHRWTKDYIYIIGSKIE